MVVNCLFLFRRDRAYQLEKWTQGEGPIDFLYGFPLLENDKIASDFAEGDDRSNDWRRRLCYPFESIISRTVGIGFSIHIAIIHWSKIVKSDVVVSTVDTCGLPLALLKWLKLIKTPVIYISQGLAHRLHSRRGSLIGRVTKYIYSRFLQSIERVLVLGEGAAFPVIDELDINSDDVFVLQFGVDDQFWTPYSVEKYGDYILSVGTDAARDYPTLLNAIDDQFVRIISRQRIPDNLLGSNVQVSSEHSFLELRNIYRGARFVVVPLHDVDQPSGQSVALQAMACGRAVIITCTQGLWEPQYMRHQETCYLVNPGDVQNLRETISYLCANPEEVEKVGANARRLVESRYNVRSLASDLQRHIIELASG